MDKKAETFSFSIVPVGEQFITRLIYDDETVGLEMPGSTIKESVYSLLNLMGEYQINSLQDVQDFAYKARG